MSYVPFSCDATFKNVSLDKCNKTIKEAKVILLAEAGFFLTKDDWLDEAIIQGYIADKKLRPIHVVNLLENTSPGDVVEEINGVESVVKHGEGRFKYQIKATTASYPDYKSLEQRSGSVFNAFIIDKADEIGGVFKQNGDLYPISLNSLTFGQPPITADGTTYPKYEMVFRFDYEALAYQSFGYTGTGLLWSTIDGLVDVDLTDATITGAVVTVTVKASADATAINGLVFGDFADIDSQATTALTETSSGIYDVTYGSAPATGTYSVELKLPTTQTTKLYETETAATLTVV